LLKHEHFEELCAAASVGQATAEELAELEQHASDCYFCRQAYLDYVSIAAHEFVAALHSPALSLEEAQECLDSELFTRRFFDRAEREGIVFSEQVERENNRHHPIPFSFSVLLSFRPHAKAMAVAALVILTISTGYMYRKGLLNSRRFESVFQGSAASEPAVSVTPLSKRVADPTDANQSLEAEIGRVSGELAKANNQLIASETDQKSIAQDRKKFASDRDTLEAQLLQLRRELARSQAMVSGAQQEAEIQRKHAGDLEATLIASQVELNELTEKLQDESAALDKERDLLAIGHDVSDLMGARNLHILDVVDTDSRGKHRPAFGRIFFTEGKSLVFYAYDLNEAKMQKSNYQYQVWAKKEALDQPVRRLGIFYSDDKAQHRWVFKCDNPKILKEIDSVFVTLGHPNSDPAHPEGARLMHAYLRGIPNHP
jgi:hypothetical protein